MAADRILLTRAHAAAPLCWLVGIGVGASVIDAWGYTGAYWLAAVSALVSVGIAAFLRQPGRREVAAPKPSASAMEKSLEPTLAD
jgi:hypothetical protein